RKAAQRGSAGPPCRVAPRARRVPRPRLTSLQAPARTLAHGRDAQRADNLPPLVNHIRVVLLCLFLALVAVAAAAGASRGPHALTVSVRGNGKCLWAVRQPPLGRITRPSDRFELRSPTTRSKPLGRL